MSEWQETFPFDPLFQHLSLGLFVVDFVLVSVPRSLLELTLSNRQPPLTDPLEEGPPGGVIELKTLPTDATVQPSGMAGRNHDTRAYRIPQYQCVASPTAGVEGDGCS